MKKNYFQNVIKEMDTEFDTHKFIKGFILIYEKEYVELLHSHIDSRNGIFRAAHSVIGKFLSDKSSSLKIEKTDKVESENIKDYNNENQKWRKIK